MMTYQWLIMLPVGAAVSLFIGVPRIFIGNVVFEPRRKTELITWILIVIISLALFVLHKYLILEMEWVPFIVGLFGTRAIIILFANRVVDKGMVPERILRCFYFLKLRHPHPYETCILPAFVKKTLGEEQQDFDDLAYAVICAQLSWIAYQYKVAVTQCAIEWGLSGERVTKDNLSFIILHDATTIFIAFTGTDDLKDWAVNLDGRPQKIEWGCVHTGFNQAAESLWSDLERMIQEARINNPAIWLAGHSLGGALAVISAVKLAFSDIGSPTGIVTFGQPAVGDLSFCKAFGHNLGSRMFRFVNCQDEVPNQPPGYLHTGRLLYFDRKGRLHKQPKKIAILTDQFFRETRGFIEEHSMLQYLKLIEHIVMYKVGAIEKLDDDLWEAWRQQVEQQGNLQR
jgi:triacylglycerol lipase